MAYCGSFYVEKRRGEKMKRLWEYMKPYKRLAILAPILMLLEVGAELAMPKLMTFMINQGVGTGNTAIITKTGIEMLVIAIIGIIGGIGCLICATLVSQRTGTDLRRAAFEKIQEFSFHNIDTFSTPSLITRLTNDITQIQLVIMICLRMLVRSPLLCIGSIIMAFSINAKIAGMFLIVVVLLAIAVYLILRVAIPKFKLVQEKLDKVNTVMRECLAGIRVVKAFVRHDYEVEKFNEANQDYKETTVSAFRMMLLMSPVMMILVNGTIIGILWFGGLQTRKGYTSDVWKVALTQERRHELNAEFSLYFDLCRMGLAEEWFRCEYPKTKANSTPEECWETGDSFRYFEHQKYQEIFPIPTNEILNNPLINSEDQNEGY